MSEVGQQPGPGEGERGRSLLRQHFPPFCSFAMHLLNHQHLVCVETHKQQTILERVCLCVHVCVCVCVCVLFFRSRGVKG